MKVVAFTTPSGRVRILAPEWAIREVWFEGERIGYRKFAKVAKGPGRIINWAETEEEFIDRIVKKDVPEGSTNVTIMDESEYTNDRTFRNAFEQNTVGKLKVNMPKARDIWMDKIRFRRNDKLAEKDIEYMQALEEGNAVTMVEIAEQKKKLRDLPETFDLTSATTPTALKNLWPTEELEEGPNG